MRGKTVAAALLAVAMALFAGACFSQEQYRSERSAAAHRNRRIIFNNDGDDHILRGEASVEAFLAARTTPLLGSQVDTIVYCTSRPFGMFTHDSRIGDVLTDKTPFAPDRNNIVSDLIQLGTDPLQAMVGFCRENQLEVIWSMRMNDTHDASHSPDRPQYYWSSFKEEHPDYLFGTRGGPPAHGAWSAVDFAEAEVRDFLFRVFEEVCGRYDVDGLEMDFFRHLVLFRTVANGGVATAEEREMLTDFVRRVRQMTEVEGMRRGKPILLSARLPDSVGYCRDMGIDLEQWLAEGLLDFFVAGGDFRLSPWEYSADLGRRFDVPVYCDLDPCLPYGLNQRFDRNSLAAYRGRALEVWDSGCAGVYLFNMFSPQHPLWWELGDAEELGRSDALYFANASGALGYVKADRALSGGSGHANRPQLHPLSPVKILPGASIETTVWARQPGAEATVTCHILAGLTEAPQLDLNGEALDGTDDSDGWFSYQVRPGLLRQGINEVRVTDVGQAGAAREWDVEYLGQELLRTPWSARRRPADTEATVRADGLLIADHSTARGSYLYYDYPWAISPDTQAVVEAEVKVEEGRSTIIVSNGVAEEEVRLYEDRLEAGRAGLSWAHDATDDFHRYRVELDGSDLLVFVDGQLRLDATGKFTAPAYDGRNAVEIGASTSGTTGAACWRSVRLQTGGISLHDIVLSVTYPPNPKGQE